MNRLSENYYARQCYLKSDQVPTQSVMKKAMQPPLAEVYFKSMSPKLRVIAGLDPPLKGGGNNWYMPPSDVLSGRAVLKPIEKEHLSKLTYLGIDEMGMNVYQRHLKRTTAERERLLQENDENWQQTVQEAMQQLWKECSKAESEQNTIKIKDAVRQFYTLYSSTTIKIENTIYADAVKQIEETRNNAFKEMQDRYETFLQQQATMLYDRYTEKLMKEKAYLKAKFIENLEINRDETATKIHDLKVEKYVAVDKLRKFLECQNLACQVYVAMKEREECAKKIHKSKREHETEMKTLTEELRVLDYDLHLAKEKENVTQDYLRLWKKKVCHVLKKLEMFVLYTIKELPEQADFFINAEQLLLLQISETLENPSVESIFVKEDAEMSTPVPRPHPFYLLGDKGYKPRIEQDLCPKHCTSSASQLPVIIINKRFIYAACDNVDQFTDKITQFVYRKRGDDADFVDDYDYDYTQPVKFSSSAQQLERKLEGSLLQLLQQEIANITNGSVNCEFCNMPNCYCIFSRLEESHDTEISVNSNVVSPNASQSTLSCKELDKEVALKYGREPKWESYLHYVKSKKCLCVKTVKEHLGYHLPPYMRRMSRFEAPELLNYEICSLTALKNLVKQAKGTITSRPSLDTLTTKYKDVATQYIDPEHELLCTCYSDEETMRFLKDLSDKCKLFHVISADRSSRMIDFTSTSSYLTKRPSSFVRDRTLSLMRLFNVSPELREIYKKKDCSFNKM